MFAKTPIESKYPSMWAGLVAGMRVPFGRSSTIPYFRGETYTALGATNAPTVNSPSQEVVGAVFAINSDAYYRRYPIAMTYPLTVSVWFRQTNSTNYGDIYSLADNAGNAWLFLTVESGGAGLRLDLRRFSGGFAATQSTQTVSLDRWHHIAMVIASSSSATCWLNGVPVISASTNIIAASSVTTVGVGRFLYGTTVSGTANPGSMLGEILEYNRELSGAEIQSLSFGRSPFQRRHTTLVGKPGAGSTATPWLYLRSSSISRPYLQVA